VKRREDGKYVPAPTRRTIRRPQLREIAPLADTTIYLERTGLIGAGTNLHGLRVSDAVWRKRSGDANNSEVADLLGDKSERMGKHDTRHVEAEANVIRAFTRVGDAK
jgi:hypothetical protein